MIDHLPLAHLIGLTKAFLTFVDWVGRPLSMAERQQWRWIALAWESKAVKAAVKAGPADKLDYYHDLMGQIRDVFVPDPPMKSRLKRTAPADREAELNEGNYSLKVEVGRGYQMPHVKKRDLTDWLTSLAKHASACAMLAYYISLATDSRQADAAEMMQLALEMNKQPAAAKTMRLARAMARHAKQLLVADLAPTEKPTQAQIEANARTLAELRAPAPTSEEAT